MNPGVGYGGLLPGRETQEVCKKVFHRIMEIEARDGYRLAATFMDGSRREYDVGKLFTVWPGFAELKKPGVFEQVRVDTGGYGVVWNDEIDLSAEDIYEFGRNAAE